MHNQVAIAPDRAGKVGIVLQRQAEMAKVFRVVIRLLHRSQGRDIDQFVELGALGLAQQIVQVPRLQHLPFGQRKAGRLRHLAQRLHFLRAGFFVDPEQQRALQAVQLFGGGNIGLDHELFDHAMCVEPFIEADRLHAAVITQNDLAFRQVQIQWLALGAGQFGRLIGAKQRCDDLLQQRRAFLVRIAVLGLLHLKVIQRGVGFHQTPGKPVADLFTLRVQHQTHGHTGALNPLVQRTQIARQPVRQHRNDPVGEIAGVAALAGLTVQGRAGRHVKRHIGDCDPNDEPAGVFSAVIGAGIYRVVMVARISRVDRDQRQVAQVFAIAQGRGFRRICLGDHAVGKGVGNAMLVDGDQADGLGRGRVTQPGNDARLGQAHARFRPGLLRLDQFTILGAIHIRCGDHPFLVLALVDGLNAPPFRGLFEHAQKADWIGADAPDQTAFVKVIGVFHLAQSRQNPVADLQCWVRGFGDQQNAGLIALALPFHRLGVQIAIGVGRQHLAHRHRGQLVRIAIRLGAFRQMALALQLAQDAFQVDPVISLDPKSARNVAFRGQGRVVGNPLQDFVL